MREIRKYVEAKGIPYLVHFTRTKNLASIFEHGIVPRAQIDDGTCASEINDHLRLDCQTGAVCLSIAFPNARMLWKLRQENPGTNWAVLVISRQVLWEAPCAFCPTNAASNDVTSKPIQDLMTVDAFKQMYDPVVGIDRSAQALRDFDPTDVQAEILHFGTVPTERIIGGAFQRRAMKEHYQPLFGEKKTLSLGDKGFFSQRDYHRRQTVNG